MVSGLLLIYGISFAGFHVRARATVSFGFGYVWAFLLDLGGGGGGGVGGRGENLGKEGSVSFIILVSLLNVMLTILYLVQIKVALYEQFSFCHSV